MPHSLLWVSESLPVNLIGLVAHPNAAGVGVGSRTQRYRFVGQFPESRLRDAESRQFLLPGSFAIGTPIYAFTNEPVGIVASTFRSPDNIPLQFYFSAPITIRTAYDIITNKPVLIAALALRPIDDKSSWGCLSSSLTIRTFPIAITLQKPVSITALALGAVIDKAAFNN